jgi:hypothetical protein
MRWIGCRAEALAAERRLGKAIQSRCICWYYGWISSSSSLFGHCGHDSPTENTEVQVILLVVLMEECNALAAGWKFIWNG